LPSCSVRRGTVRKPSARNLALLGAQAALFLLLFYYATPAGWWDPFAFVIADLKYMSQHPWDGCTLTAGQCIGREFDNSAINYLGLWYVVQLPIFLGIDLSRRFISMSAHSAMPKPVITSLRRHGLADCCRGASEFHAL
jgi:hypothetical protein